MCSLIDFIENENIFIKTELKRIESLRNFLSDFDKQFTTESISQSFGVQNKRTQRLSSNQTNGVDVHNNNGVPLIVDKSPVEPQVLQLSHDLMSNSYDGLSWLRFGNHEEEHKRLAEERRREFNEYLKEKTRIQSERRKRREINNMTEMTTGMITSNYNEILDRKRNEERKHRQINGMDNIEEETTHIKSDFEPKTIGWFTCSNNKFVPEFITPRSRLLATHSSRIRAAQYREELTKQIEEKKRIIAEEKERIRLEDMKLERKVEQQRLKMLREYSDEQRLLRKKTNELLKRQEVLNLMPNKEKDTYPSTSPLSLLRSPSYLEAREARVMRSPIRRAHHKVSRSLAPELHSIAAQTINQKQNISAFGASGDVITHKSDQNFDSTSSESSFDLENEPNSQQKDKNNQTFSSELKNEAIKTSDIKSNGRVMSQLTEVRQMMQNDHKKMIEQLRDQLIRQQIDQNY